jgi:TrmH family RNA methyltransferase
VSPPRSRIASRDNALLVQIRKLNASPDAYRKLGVVWLEGDHLIGAAQARGWPIGDALVPAAREADPRAEFRGRLRAR